MSTEESDLTGFAKVLFTHFYDDETGAFKRSVNSIQPDPFSTIEALYSLLHSPAKSAFQEQIKDSLRYLVDKLEEWDGKTEPYSGAESPACDYSTLSISFSLIVLARGRKFIQNHSLSSKLEIRITDMIENQLRLLILAKKDDGWSYVPSEGVDHGGYEFEPNVYCTAISLQALINCKRSDFPPEVDSSRVSHETEIVDATRALLHLANIPDVTTKNGDLEEANIETAVFEEAVLMTHWMHVLSHVLYDTDRWAEDTTQPSDLTDVDEMLRESSELTSTLILNAEKYTNEIKYGFADISYDLELEYPRKTPEETIEKDSFNFALPGSTALPALVLNPNVSLWSEANLKINKNVTGQFKDRQDDLQRYGIGDGKEWPLHSLSAPLVGISYMQSVNQGIKTLIKHFIQEGEIPNVGQSNQEKDQIKEVSIRESETNHEQIDGDDGLPENPNDPTQQEIGSFEHSILVQGAITAEKLIGKAIRHITGRYKKIAVYSRAILLLLLIMCLGAYVYIVSMNLSDTQILITASLSGLIASLTVYDFLMEWVENRPASALGGASALIVIATSASVFTSITNDVLIFGTALIPALGLITNIIVSSRSE